ncbi:MAG TPA: hypothetical protein VGL06_20845 [Pseudonocardiaceae bacterium]|jgi:RsiW-degrading membrane proteinase PrsW (M82 family)
MNDNAGQPPVAANKDPAKPANNPARRRSVTLSQGNGIVEQAFDFIREMSAGNGVQRAIAVFLAVILPVMFLATMIFIDVTQHASPLLVAGATLLSGTTTAAVVARKQRRSKAAPDQPRD